MLKNKLFYSTNTVRRSFSSIVYEKFGAPIEVCLLKSFPDVESPGPNEVKVSVKSSEILAEDIRSISGLSLITKNPGVGGISCIGSVAQIGSNVPNLSLNDKVYVVARGTWRTSIKFPVESVLKLPALSFDKMSQFSSSLIAHSLLHNFVRLKSGDTIVQSSGDSIIGKKVSELGSYFGYKVLSPSRSELGDERYLETLKQEHTVKLVLSPNCDDKLSRSFLRLLVNSGPANGYVLYNGDASAPNSLPPLQLPISYAVFNNISVYGFDYFSYFSTKPVDFQRTFSAVSDLYAAGVLDDSKAGAQAFPLSDYQSALRSVQSGQAATLTFP